jgi:hypothetical protein
MKRQTRPFTVEIKRARKLPGEPLLSRNQSAALYSRSASCGHEDVHGKLVARTASFDREVKTMIETANGPANDPTSALDHAPAEVLPSLSRARKTGRPRTPKQVSKPAEPESQVPE